MKKRSHIEKNCQQEGRDARGDGNEGREENHMRGRSEGEWNVRESDEGEEVWTRLRRKGAAKKVRA